MLRFDIKTGIFYEDDKLVAVGYSGFGDWKNNPEAQKMKGLGPIPCGQYHIGAAYDSPNTGPMTLPLEALPGTDTFGRGDFKIHGDSRIHPGAASHGCIILPRNVREWVNKGEQKTLEVFTSES